MNNHLKEEISSGSVDPPVSHTCSGSDGLLYCSVCHEAKEAWYTKEGAPPVIRGMSLKHPRMCACDRKAAKEKAERARLMNHIRETERLQKEGFPEQSYLNISFSSSERSEEMMACEQYIDAWERMKKENIGLLFYGDVGSGKTHAAVCMANALIEKEYPVRMLNFGQTMHKTFEEKGRILDMIPTYDLLILDDFGIERTTEYSLEFIFSVVDARYQSRKPVIVTTNLSLKTLRSPKDLEHQRIYDRILEMCIPVFFVGKDYRKEVQKTKYLSFQNLYHEEN